MKLLFECRLTWRLCDSSSCFRNSFWNISIQVLVNKGTDFNNDKDIFPKIKKYEMQNFTLDILSSVPRRVVSCSLSSSSVLVKNLICLLYSFISIFLMKNTFKLILIVLHRKNIPCVMKFFLKFAHLCHPLLCLLSLRIFLVMIKRLNHEID